MVTDQQESVMTYTRSRLPSKAKEVFDSWFYEAKVDNELIAVNRFLRTQLSKLNTDTIDARECLLDGCDIGEWEMLFDEHVLPVIEEHGLPK